MPHTSRKHHALHPVPHPQREGEGPQPGVPQHYRPTHTPNFAPPPGSSPQRGFNLFVGTLPAGTQKEDLEILFSPFGMMTDTYMLKQEGLGGRRCGFVSYGSYLSAALAINILNGFIIWPGELPICVRFANPVKQPCPEQQPRGAATAAALLTSPAAALLSAGHSAGAESYEAAAGPSSPVSKAESTPVGSMTSDGSTTLLARALVGPADADGPPGGALPPPLHDGMQLP